MKKIDSLIGECQDGMILSLQGLLQIDSVISDPLPEMPFGEGPAKALDYTLELCRSLGFATKNCDGYIGYAEAGQGEEMLGILVHLDVVPAGNGWSHPAFGGEIAGGELFGRGVVDNKGPAVACIYAVKAILDAGILPNKRIRIIFGLDEENDWRDMKHYLAHEEIPSIAFTPDAEFPLIYAEKGILMLELSMKKEGSGIRSIQGGQVVNAVPDHCQAVVAGINGEDVVLQAKGIAAHGSTPEQGQNAISKLMAELYQLHLQKKADCPFSVFYHQLIGDAIHGEKIGIDCQDESGRLTFNVGLANCDEDAVRLMIDIRHPVTSDREQLLEAIQTKTAPFGVEITKVQHKPSLFMEKDHPLVQTLLSTYRELTGDNAPPLAIGGGTYARAIPNAVAFGPGLPGRPRTEHQKDERIALEDLELIARIYAHAIYRLVS